MKFERITACGECCDGCEKRRAGTCPGCIEAEGSVPEWRESGGCPFHRCARRHGVQFCGLCPEFPCDFLRERLTWNPDAIPNLARLARQYWTENDSYRPCPELEECRRLMEGYYDQGRYEACFQGLLALAEKGYPLAEYQVGSFCLRGLGTEKDPKRAYDWTKRAAEHGDREGQYSLAELYARGTGTDPDPEAARFWYRQAALQDHVLALEKCRALGIEVREREPFFKIESLYICVRDLDRAVAFWEDFFEMPISRRDELGGTFDVRGFRFMLFAHERVGEAHTYGSNCLPSIEVESLSALRRKLADKQVRFPITRIGPNWVAEFVDSEGNPIEIFARAE